MNMRMKQIACAMLLLLTGWWSNVSAQEIISSDTTLCEVEKTPQPTDDKFRVVTNRFFDNWFIMGAVGGHMFAGDGCQGVNKMNEHYSPDFYVGLGKWFTPGIGARVQYGVGRSQGHSDFESVFAYGEPFEENGTLHWRAKTDWWDISAQAMFNLSRLIYGYEGKNSDRLKNQFIFTVGIGGVHHFNTPARRNEWSGHFELQYSRFFDKEKKWSLDVKLHSVLYQTNFDGKVGGQYRPWDANHGLAVGITYFFKKRHWDRCSPCGTVIYNNIAPVETKEPVVIQNCPEYGVMEFYVFFPNNYSGRNDAPTVEGAPVNAIDYLASGIFTQTRFDNTEAVEKRLRNGQSLLSLRTSDIPTQKANVDDGMGNIVRGYEMSSLPMSLSMNADSMNVFKEKAGYYYSPIYKAGNTWYYRVDDETALQRLVGTANYREEKSYSLNAHEGLDLVKTNMKPDEDAKLFSFADVYAALEGYGGNLTKACNEEDVKQLNRIFDEGRILYVISEGLATSQDNYIGKDAEKVGLERNKALAFNRASTVTNWLKANPKFKKVPENVFMVNALKNPVVDVKDESVQGLNAKLGRSVKVRIFYVID